MGCKCQENACVRYLKEENERMKAALNDIMHKVEWSPAEPATRVEVVYLSILTKASRALNPCDRN